jgi:transcription antitermination factor NusA-like protein
MDGIQNISHEILCVQKIRYVSDKLALALGKRDINIRLFQFVLGVAIDVHGHKLQF